MKKLLLSLILCTFLFSFISAEITIDNAIQFESNVGNHGQYVIKDLFGIGATTQIVKLEKNNGINCGRYCSAEFEIHNLKDDMPLITGERFITIYSNNRRVEEPIRSSKYYLKTGENEIEVNDYGEFCDETGRVDKNGTKEISCTNEIIGTHKELIPIWEEYEIGKPMKSGTYIIKKEGEKKPDRVVDWQISFGKNIIGMDSWSNEWAVWGNSYVVEEEVPSIVLSSSASTTDSNRGMRIVANDNFTIINVTRYQGTDATYCAIRSSANSELKNGTFVGQNCYLNYTVTAGTTYRIIINSLGSAYTLKFNATSYSPVYTTTYGSYNLTGGYDHLGNLDTTNFYSLGNMTISRTFSTITLNSPVNNYVSPINNVQFNCSANVVGGATLTNISLWTNSSGTWARANTTTTNGANMNYSFTEGSYIWSCQACDSDSACGFASENRTVSIDTTAPSIAIITPTGNQGIKSVPYNVTLNFTVSDSNLDSCWYNSTFNSTITYVTCNAVNIVSINSFYPEHTIYLYSNDSVNNLGMNYTTFNSAIINSITYTSTVLEGSSSLYILNLSSKGDQSITASFNYDNNYYSSSKYGNDANMTFTNTINHNSSGVKNLFWEVTIGSNKYNTSTVTQTVSALSPSDNCTDREVIFNFTVVDEETLVNLPSGSGNMKIEVTIDTYSSSGNYISTYSLNSTSNSFAICSNATISNSSSSLILYTLVRYEGNATWISEFYTKQNFTLSNSTLYQNITLYDLKSADAQEFKVTYKNANFLPVPDSILEVQRKYISDGIFRVVEAPPFDNDGNTLANLVLGEVIYTLVVKKDNQILGTFDNVLAYCNNVDTGDCEINLNSFSSSLSPNDYSKIDGVTFSMNYDKTTREVQSIFTVNDGSSKTLYMNVTLNDMYGNTTVCSDILTSSSGTLSCIIPASYGNATATAYLYKVGSKIYLGSLGIDLWTRGENIFGTSRVMLTLISFLCLIGVALSSGAAVILIFAIVGMVMIGSLFLISGTGLMNIGTAALWLIIGILVVLWKISRRND